MRILMFNRVVFEGTCTGANSVITRYQSMTFSGGYWLASRKKKGERGSPWRCMESVGGDLVGFTGGHQGFERGIELLQGVDLQIALLVDLRGNLRCGLAMDPDRRQFLATEAFGLANVLQVRVVERGDETRFELAVAFGHQAAVGVEHHHHVR